MCIGCCPVFLQKMSINFSSVTHGDTFAGIRWCLISSSHTYFGEKKLYTLYTFGQPQGMKLVSKILTLHEHISHKLELKMSFRCPTKGCSNNWAFLLKIGKPHNHTFPEEIVHWTFSNLFSFWRLALLRTLSISTEQEEKGNLFLFSAMCSAVAFSVTMW